jgi:two-component system response regulator HydG
MTPKTTILIVDDDHAHRTMLQTLLGSWGYQIEQTADGGTAVERVRHRPYDLVLMDVRMVEMSGIEALAAIKAFNPAIPVVIMTAYASVETAVAALKSGAYDYLTKPLDFEKLKITITRAMEHALLKSENERLHDQLGARFQRGNIIGNSPAMRQMLETIAQVAPSEATVLITGESGTGKELVAGALHYNSPRRKGPFMRINCAAITESLLESELFGHERGAFTGADRRKEGCFVRADGGTLFLDEISAMPLTMQAKLLRVLQEREVTRVGGESVLKIDVRVVAATNRDLVDMIAAGDFREDLFYRLNVVTVTLPPLIKRTEDIPLLTQHFLEQFNRKNQRELKGISPAAMDCLLRHNWPGNVRELMNVVERAVVMTRTDYLLVEDLPPELRQVENIEDEIKPAGFEGPLTLEASERIAILRAMTATDGNKSQAARQLGITRKTLRKKLKQYWIEK